MSPIWLPFIGFFITLYALSIGRGGGLLYVGILTAFVGIPAEAAISTSLAILVPTTIAGAWSHWRQGNVSVKLGSLLLVSGCIGTAAASTASRWLSPGLCRKFVGLVFLGTLAKLVFDYFKEKKVLGQPTLLSKEIISQAWKPVSYGALGGVLSGVSGMSGSTAIIAGLLSCGCPPIQVIGTSLFAIAGIALMGFLARFKLGLVNWSLVAELCSGSIVASVLSPFLLKKIPTRQLDRFFPVVMILVISAATYRLLFL